MINQLLKNHFGTTDQSFITNMFKDKLPNIYISDENKQNIAKLFMSKDSNELLKKLKTIAIDPSKKYELKLNGKQLIIEIMED